MNNSANMSTFISTLMQASNSSYLPGSACPDARLHVIPVGIAERFSFTLACRNAKTFTSEMFCKIKKLKRLASAIGFCELSLSSYSSLLFFLKKVKLGNVHVNPDAAHASFISSPRLCMPWSLAACHSTQPYLVSVFTKTFTSEIFCKLSDKESALELSSAN